MTINTEHFNDSLITKAHVAFLVLMIASLLNKDEVSTSQLLGISLASGALPLLIGSLAFLPGEEKIPPWQVKAIQFTNPTGHGIGLISFACVLWSFTPFATVMFSITTVFAILVFGFVVIKTTGVEDPKEYLKAITEDESDEEPNK